MDGQDLAAALRSTFPLETRVGGGGGGGEGLHLDFSIVEGDGGGDGEEGKVVLTPLSYVRDVWALPCPVEVVAKVSRGPVLPPQGEAVGCGCGGNRFGEDCLELFSTHV